MDERDISTRLELQERLRLGTEPSLSHSSNRAVTAVQLAMKGIVLPPQSAAERVRSANTSRILTLLVEQAG